MLELTPARAAIVSCLDEGPVLDGMPDFPGAFKARTAPDELWLIAPASAAATLLAHAGRYLEGAASHGLAIDLSDGWSVLTVRGTEVSLVWERFSENPLPAGRPVLVQGAVAMVATKAIVFDTHIHFVNPAPLGYHLKHRILNGCADLAPRLTPSAEFAL